MPDWKGAQTVAAMVYSGGGAWNTEVACAASSAFEFESESLTPDAQFVPNTGISGNIAQIQGSKGNELHSGDIVIPMDYNIAHRFIAQVMGAAAAPTTRGSGYQHLLSQLANLEGIHGTVVLGQTGIFVRVYPTVKFTGFTVACNAGEQAKLTVNCVPDKLIVDDSGTNKLATLTNITRPSDIELTEFNHLTVLMKDQASAPLAAGDAQYISGFTLTVTNNLRGDSVTTRNAPYTDEPTRNGWFEVSGTLTFAELDANTNIVDHLAKTVKMLRISFDGAAWADLAPRYVFNMPSVQFESTEFNIGGPELAPNTVGFRCSRALSIPTGQPSADAMYVTVGNMQSGNALSAV